MADEDGKAGETSRLLCCIKAFSIVSSVSGRSGQGGIRPYPSSHWQSKPASSHCACETGEVVALAVHLGERLWRDGFRYSKCGVMISDLLPEGVQQPALWSELDR